MTRRKNDPETRELPRSLESERSVIGALLIENEGYPKIAPFLTPKMFYRDAHRKMYAACVTILEAGRPLDLVSLKVELERLDQLEDVGGPAYVASLVDGVPRSTNVVMYAQVVRDQAAYRQLIADGGKQIDAGYIAQQSPHEIIRDAELRLSLLNTDSSNQSAQSVTSMIPALNRRIAYRVEHKGKISGLPTGFPELDLYTHGWQPGHLIVIGGRTSHGKSALALNFATTIAQAGGRVVYYSFEMGETAMTDRLLSTLSVDSSGKGVPITASHWGNYSQAEFARLAHAQEAMHALDNLEFKFDTSRHVGDIERECRAIKADRGLTAVVLDHFQLIDVADVENRVQQLALISRRFQNLARDLHLVFFVLTQLTLSDAKDGNVEPDVDHIRDCKSLGHDAHGVFMLQPHKAAEARSEVPVVLMKLLIRKQREGRLGKVWLDFERDYMRFVPASEPRPEPPKPKESKPMKSALTF